VRYMQQRHRHHIEAHRDHSATCGLGCVDAAGSAINLFARRGLDIPECALVAIPGCRQGRIFAQRGTSLIQYHRPRRAKRNVDGPGHPLRRPDQPAQMERAHRRNRPAAARSRFEYNTLHNITPGRASSARSHDIMNSVYERDHVAGGNRRRRPWPDERHEHRAIISKAGTERSRKHGWREAAADLNFEEAARLRRRGSSASAARRKLAVVDDPTIKQRGGRSRARRRAIPEKKQFGEAANLPARLDKLAAQSKRGKVRLAREKTDAGRDGARGRRAASTSRKSMTESMPNAACRVRPAKLRRARPASSGSGRKGKIIQPTNLGGKSGPEFGPSPAVEAEGRQGHRGGWKGKRGNQFYASRHSTCGRFPPLLYSRIDLNILPDVTASVGRRKRGRAVRENVFVNWKKKKNRLFKQQLSRPIAQKKACKEGGDIHLAATPKTSLGIILMNAFFTSHQEKASAKKLLPVSREEKNGARRRGFGRQ